MTKMGLDLQEQLAQLVSSMGYEWVGCEQLRMGGQTVLRIYIDSPQGVTIAACEAVSRQVSALLDVEGSDGGVGAFAARYALEVSSPGLERPLFTIAHFQQFVGRRVKMKLSLPINQRRHYQGKIHHVEEGDVYLQVDGLTEIQKMPFSTIEKANLIAEF